MVGVRSGGTRRLHLPAVDEIRDDRVGVRVAGRGAYLRIASLMVHHIAGRGGWLELLVGTRCYPDVPTRAVRSEVADPVTLVHPRWLRWSQMGSPRVTHGGAVRPRLTPSVHTTSLAGAVVAQRVFRREGSHASAADFVGRG